MSATGQFSLALDKWAQLAAKRCDSERRAPRWAIAPPRDAATRSRALTQAHAVLSAPDLETAVSRFAGWADRVPDAPDGFLGWVGDHTRATPNITLLVMAAHAPRRRLSRLLDLSPPMTAGLDVIPRPVSEVLYRRYLAGLFTSRPAAVRIFAAICLARTQRGVGTWAEAIAALDLEPDEALRAVQTCVAAMTASPLEVITMLRRLADEIQSPRVSSSGAGTAQVVEHG